MPNDHKTITLNDGQIDDIVAAELKWAILNAYNTDEGGYDITDYALRDSMLHVLAYFMPRAEFFAFCEENQFDPKKFWG